MSPVKSRPITPTELEWRRRQHHITGSAHLPPQDEIDRAYVNALAQGTSRPCTGCAMWLLTYHGIVIHVPRKPQ